jgi:tetratricopeptide (TPR) repeat protein
MFRLLVFSLLVFRPAHAQETPERILQHAISLHRSGDLDEAIREYQAFLKLRPGTAQVRSNLGAALAGAGRYEEAIAEYRQALDTDPKNPPVLLNLAIAYYKSGQFTEAARRLAVIHSLQPDNQQASMLLADCQLRLGDNKQVIELLSPLETSSPDNLAVAYMLGMALIRDKQSERGQMLVDRILKNGDSAEARLLMGTTKMMVNDYAGALVDLRRAVELNSKLPDVYSYYGIVLLRTGDTAGAAEAFRKELQSNPNDFTSNLQLGSLSRRDQEPAKAIPYLERAARLRPGDPGARFQIAAAHFAMGKVDDARAELEQIVSEAPQFTEAHVTLATVYYRLKRKAEADRERAIVQKLTAERQAKEPGARAAENPDNAKNVP